MNPLSENIPLFEAAETDPVSDPALSSKAPPDPEAPRRFRPIERKQVTWMVVDLERMLDESHPARAIWDFLGGLDLSLSAMNVKAVVGSAGRDS